MSAPPDPFSLRGRRVVVTGAGRGLGQGIAIAAARAGADVVGVARSAEQLAETAERITAEGGSFVSVPADLSQPEAVRMIGYAAASNGMAWGVVHAAGGQVRKPAVDVTRHDWRLVHDVHMEAAFFLSTAIARRQLAAGTGGSHVFVASLGSSIGLPRIAPYTAAKSGVLGVVRTLAVEWAQAGIRVNAVAPGYFHTALTDELLSDPRERERVLSRIPMRRLGTPDDLAGAAVFLLSDASAYVTGQSLNVDGGWLAS
ncbi:MAG: SDR family NAD(P)-dependent oxidoreductase [Solirubrobacteraceae bacterium]